MPKPNLQTELDQALKTFVCAVRASLYAEMDRRSILAKKQVADRLRLTLREREVKDLMLSGLQNKQIADMLNIETRTVKFHVGNILRKLGVQDRHELAGTY